MADVAGSPSHFRPLPSSLLRARSFTSRCCVLSTHMRDPVLIVEDADAPFTAEPLLTTPVDFSTGAAADRAYAGALAGLVAPPGCTTPLAPTHDSLFYCVHSVPLRFGGPPSELRVRLVDRANGSALPLIALTTAQALPGDGATLYFEEGAPCRLRLAFEQGSSAGWELVAVAMRVHAADALRPQLQRIHSAAALLTEEVADGPTLPQPWMAQ